jgi:hypothetical protein
METRSNGIFAANMLRASGSVLLSPTCSKQLMPRRFRSVKRKVRTTHGASIEGLGHGLSFRGRDAGKIGFWSRSGRQPGIARLRPWRTGWRVSWQMRKNKDEMAVSATKSNNSYPSNSSPSNSWAFRNIGGQPACQLVSIDQMCGFVVQSAVAVLIKPKSLQPKSLQLMSMSAFGTSRSRGSHFSFSPFRGRLTSLPSIP